MECRRERCFFFGGNSWDRPLPRACAADTFPTWKTRTILEFPESPSFGSACLLCVSFEIKTRSLESPSTQSLVTFKVMIQIFAPRVCGRVLAEAHGAEATAVAMPVVSTRERPICISFSGTRKSFQCVRCGLWTVPTYTLVNSSLTHAQTPHV